MELRLFNTMGREIQRFEPIEKGKVAMYACGPTVYNYAHIGNLRAYLVEDILRRTLEYFGYSVSHVMNITDVGHLTDDADAGEDKMLQSARKRKKTVWEIADFYTKAFFNDTDRLHIKRPTKTPKATDHIGDMIGLIKKLEKRGYTYQSGGNIYFDISKFPDYGKLSLLDRQDLQAGARIDVDEKKKNPHDFVLWFTKGKFENQTMVWDSPWGRGYPGWHIECSAMSMRYLGDKFDIHCGGIDHIPVHHTNEIAQSEGATGKTWVQYWVHNEFLVMDKGKMSKSKGGFITLDTLISEGYDALDYRYFNLTGHYRSQLAFSYNALDTARAARKNLTERVARLFEQAKPADSNSLSDQAVDYLNSFRDNLANDLNTPKCLSTLWGAVKDETLAAEESLAVALEMDGILGLDLEHAGNTEEISEEIASLIKEREQARKEKNFARADEIRDYLQEQGIELEDTPEGTRWKRI